MSFHQTVKWKALKFDLKYGTKLQTDVEVASEGLYDLYVNENLYMTAVLTPFQLKEWSIGFLYSEGLINSAREVKRVVINDDSIEVKIREAEDLGSRLPKIGRFLSDSCASTIALRRISYIKEISEEIFSNDITIPNGIIRNLSISLNKASMTYRTTGGTHSAALFSTEGELLIYSEDVGRHNAVDKAIGSSLLGEVQLDNKILAVSGRLSEELVFKCARARIPLVISLSAPLSRGLELAKMAGITLIGFARGDRFNVYTHPHRIE